VLSYAEEGNPPSMASRSRQSIETNDSERVEFSVLTYQGVEEAYWITRYG
jgi:hypothetical protein